jgi:hypothetical protein
VASPLLAVNALALSLAYAAVKVFLGAIAAVTLTAGRQPFDRVLVLIALVLSLPFLHDVFLGNGNVILVAAMALAAFGPNRARYGIPLGLAAAIFAKPFLVPFGLWLLVRRRPPLVGTLAAGLGASLIGVLATGVTAYVEWITALVAGGRFAAPFAGNHGISALWPTVWVPIALATAVVFLVVLYRATPAVSLVWAASAGILLAPYAGTYSALPIALAMPVAIAQTPWFAIAIVAISPLATTHPLPFYAAAIMLATLVLARRRDGPSSLPLPATPA